MRTRVWLPLVGAAAALGIGLAVSGQGAEATQKGRSPKAGPGPVPSVVGCRDVPGRLDLGELDRGERVQRARLCEPPPEIVMGPRGSPPPSVGVNAELAAYGTCDAGDESACAPPLQVQTWNACERNYDQYAAHPAPDGSVPAHQRARLRGVEAAIFDEGTRIELYGPKVTVVVFAPNPAAALDAVKRLRGEVGGQSVGREADLPDGSRVGC